MAKPINSKRYEQLLAAGARPIGVDKQATPDEPKEEINLDEIRKSIADASAVAGRALSSVEAINAGLARLESIVAASMSQDTTPPITGFDLHRGSDGYTSRVTLIRGPLN